MAAKQWQGESDAWATDEDWDPTGVPGTGDEVLVDAGAPTITSDVGTIATLTLSYPGTLSMSGGALATVGDVTNDSLLFIDANPGEGGSALSVGGTLFNNDDIEIGNDTLSAPVHVTAAAFVQPTSGLIEIVGSNTVNADLSLESAAGLGTAGVLSGSVSLRGDAVLSFGSGSFTSIASGGYLSLSGAGAQVEDRGTAGMNTALRGLASNAGYLLLDSGAIVETTGAFANGGSVTLDGAGTGGTHLTIGGTFGNNGAFSGLQIGNASLLADDVVSVAGLNNGPTGTITVTGGASAASTLRVGGTAGFGSAGVLSGTVTLTGPAIIAFDSGQITSLAGGASLTLVGAGAQINDVGVAGANSALDGLASIAGRLDLEGGATVSAAGDLANSGVIQLDTSGPTLGGVGGSSLAVAGRLTNSGNLRIGSALASAPDLVMVGSLANADNATIGLAGSADGGSRLAVGSAAGFGVTGVLNGQVVLSGNSALEFATGQITSVSSRGFLFEAGALAQINDTGGVGANSALAGLASNAGSIQLTAGAALVTTGDLANTGQIGIDSYNGYGPTGGSALTIAGRLTNSGSVEIGPFGNTLAASDSLTVGTLANTGSGTVRLYGSGARSASLTVGGDALNAGAIDASVGHIAVGGALTGGGSVTLEAGSLLEIGGASDNAVIFDGAGATLKLDAPGAGFSGTISGLVAGDKLDLAGVTVTGAAVDASGTHLTVTEADGTTLTFNVSGVSGSAPLAVSNVGGDGFVTLAGPVSVTWLDSNDDWTTAADWSGGAQPGPSDNVAITHGSPIISSDVGTVGSVTVTGSLAFLGGALATAGDFTASGSVSFAATTGGGESGGPSTSVGGSTLDVGGTLTVGGFFSVENSDADDPTRVTAQSLVSTGTLDLDGAGASLAVLSDAGFGTAGVLSGGVDLFNGATISFAGGALTSIATGGSLTLGDGASQIAIAGANGANSALADLADVAGSLTLYDGASVTTSGDLAVDGYVTLDTSFAGGGSALTVNGRLTNTGTLQVGSSQLSSDDVVTAGSLANTGGSIALTGGAEGAVLAIGDVAGFGTAGEVDGVVSLTGNAVITFASGALTSIAAGAQLTLSGADARIDDAGGDPDSALADLAANNGTLTLSSATLTVLGDFANAGTLRLDPSYAAGGSTFDVRGTLGNSSYVQIGPQGGSSSASDTIYAFALDNAPMGSFVLTGGENSTAALIVNGDAVNAGTITAADAYVYVGGATTGGGTFTLNDGSFLELGWFADNNVVFDGFATLKLDAADVGFTGTLSDLSAGDTIDLVGLDVVSAQISEDASQLTVTEADGTALVFALAGIEAGTSFALGDDGDSGTSLVLSDVTTSPPAISAPATAAVTEGVGTSLGPIVVSDDDPLAEPVTVLLSVDNAGAGSSATLSAQQVGSATVDGDGLNQPLTLTGSLADVNAELATLTYTGALRSSPAATTSDVVRVVVLDSDGQEVEQAIAVTVGTGAVLVSAPTSVVVVAGTSAALAGIALSDSATQAGTFTVAITSGGGTLRATASGSAVLAGQASPSLVVSGTLADVNAVLASLAYEGAPIGNGSTAADRVTVTVTDPNGAQDRQIVGVTVYAAPYDGVRAASGRLAADINDFAPDAQVIADALSLAAASSAGAIGALAGPLAQAAYRASAQTALLGGSGTAPAASSLYDTLLQGVFGTLVGGDLLPSFGLYGTINALVVDAQNNAGHVDTDIGLLEANISAFYGQVGGAASGSAPFQSASDASQQLATVLGNDVKFGASSDQVLADTVALYQSLFSGAFGALGGTAATDASTAALGALGNDLAGGAGAAQLLADVTGVYDPLVRQVSAAANSTALQSYGATMNSASVLTTQVATAPNITLVRSVAQDVLFNLAPQLLGLPLSDDLSNLLDKVATLAAAVKAGDSPDQIFATSASWLSELFGSSPDAQQSFDAFVAGLPVASGATDTQVFNTSGTDILADLLSILSTLSPDASADIVGGLNGLKTDTAAQNADAVTGDLDTLMKGLFDQATVDPLGLTDAEVQSLLTEIANNLGANPGNDPLGTIIENAPVFLIPFVPAAAPFFFWFKIGQVAFSVIDWYIDHRLPLVKPHGTDPGNFRGQWDALKNGGSGGKGGGHGDIHLQTFTGQAYDFQAVGEFVLARSTKPGNTFEVQERLAPWHAGASVSVATAVAVQVGADKLTFAFDRTNAVWLNGAPSALTATNSILDLAGGQVVELTPTAFRVTWTTGEVLTLTYNSAGYIDTEVTPADSDFGALQGLLGTGAGRANDFTLPDGTVLPQPLTGAELYGAFADAWRVSDATSLFDYGPGQSTATFTDAGFPHASVTLADFPADLVAKAAALAAAAGITDPVIAAQAELDYLATGDTSFFASGANAQQPGTNVTAAPVIPTPPVASAGVRALQDSVKPASGQSVLLTFQVYLTAAVATDTILDFAVIATKPGALGASTFGGTLPSGQVTILAGQAAATFAVTVPAGALAQNPTAELDVAITSDTVPVSAPTAHTTLISPTPVAGTPASPVLVELTQAGTLTHAGSAYTLALGAIVQGETLPVTLALANLAAGLADGLAGTLGSSSGFGFALRGGGTFPTIDAGSSYNFYIVPDTSELGSYGQTITILPSDTNVSGYAAALPGVTLTITDTVVAPAQARLDTAPVLDFGAVRLGSDTQQLVSISNTAAAGAALLDVTGTTNGGARVFGAIEDLAPGATDAADLSVGIQTDVAGRTSGVLTLTPVADAGGGTLDLPTLAIDVSGTVYRPAQAQVAAVSKIVHVGDAGYVPLTVGNADPADGYSENLLVAVGVTSGGISASGTPGPIAAGAQDSSISLGFSTAQAAEIAGSVTLALRTDGTGVDGLPALDLAPAVVPVEITVDAYAQLEVSETAGGGTLTRGGATTTIDLGAILQNSGARVVHLQVANGAAGPADLLSGSFDLSGSGAFMTTGFDAFAGLVAGAADAVPTVTLDTSALGTFTETIRIDATGSNSSGYSGALTSQVVTITGRVVAQMPVDIVDTAANVAAELDALEAAGNVSSITLTDPGTPVLHVTGAQFAADAAVLGLITNGTYTLYVTEGDGSFFVREITPDGRTETTTNTSGHRIELATFDANGNRVDDTTFDGTGRETGEAHYAGGQLQSSLTYYPGTDAVEEFVRNGITGLSYTGLDYTYAPDGTPTRQLLYGAGHVKIYDYTFDPATGTRVTAFFDAATGAPVKTTTTNADGSFDIRTYEPSGSSVDFVFDAGSHPVRRDIYDTLTHKSETLAYDAAGRLSSDTSYAADGTVAYAATYRPGTDELAHVDRYGITGVSYTGLHLDYDAGGALAFERLDLADGGFATIAFGDGRTLTSTAGVADSLQAAGQSEVFAFGAEMGNDLVTSFVAAGTGHDTLQFAASLLPAAGTTDSFLAAYATDVAATGGAQPQPASVLFTFDPSNSVLVRGTTVATLQANPGDFAFV